MTPARTFPARGSARKSPLRLAADPLPAISPQTAASPAAPRPQEQSPQQMRKMMISEFCQWLGSRTNRFNRPFQADTISAYRDAAVALDAWMTTTKIRADFTGCGTGDLNRFFRWYYDKHGQGGTNTKQRNLRHLFTWLEAEYSHPHPTAVLRKRRFRRPLPYLLTRTATFLGCRTSLRIRLRKAMQRYSYSAHRMAGLDGCFPSRSGLSGIPRTAVQDQARTGGSRLHSFLHIPVSEGATIRAKVTFVVSLRQSPSPGLAAGG